FFADHPDFKNRNPKPGVVKFTNFDPSLAPYHGTRSAGLVSGPLKPSDGGKRYGVAYETEITTGGVLDYTGLPDDALIAGLEYAIQHAYSVVNMSLGHPVLPGETYSPVLELVAQRALHAGVLAIASAGNDESANGIPVFHPANCPSVLAVGALDGRLNPFP